MARSNGLVVARVSFFSGNTFVRAGDAWAEDDPVVTHFPPRFRPLVVHTSEDPAPRISEPQPAPAKPARVGGRFARKAG